MQPGNAQKPGDMYMQENILVIKHGALGDFVMQSGRMKTIRARHPTAHIAVVTEGFLKGLAEAMGLFDEVIVDSRGYNIPTWWRVIVRELAGRKWNAIYDLQSSNRTLCRYYPLALAATRHPMHWARLAKGGLVWRESSGKLPFCPWIFRNRFEPVEWLAKDLSMCHGDHAHFAELPTKYALLIPGCSAGNVQKRWPPERYRELVKFFAAKGLKSVVMGTKAEATEINAICDSNPDAVNFLGKSSIADIPDLANSAEIVVGNDTGPSHIARIAGAKTVMLFTDYDYKRAASPNERVVCLHSPEITGISVSQVEADITRLMADRAE